MKPPKGRRLQLVLYPLLAIVLGLGRACQLHVDCLEEQFCAQHSCFAPAEGFAVSCGVCRPCADCTTHLQAIDSACPERCGTPLYSTELLSGRFYSVDSADCLTIWLFEGFTFERFRTGFSFSGLHDDTFRHYGNGECQQTGIERGIFDFDRGEGGSTLSLKIPADYLATYYEIFSVFIKQGKIGLDLIWPGGREETLLPLKNPQTGPDAALKLENLSVYPLSQHSWRGTLQVFDTLCTAILDMNLLPSAASSMSTAPSVYTWRINTWDCAVGPARAPGMDSADERSILEQAAQSPPASFWRRKGDITREAGSRSRLLLATASDDEVEEGPPLMVWPDMTQWVAVAHRSNATVQSFDFWYNGSWSNLLLSECEIYCGERRLGSCTHGAICRRAIMSRNAFEWNLNKTGGITAENDGPLFPLSASQIRGCVCNIGYAPSQECTDSTLDDFEFAHPNLRSNISSLFSNSTGLNWVRVVASPVDGVELVNAKLQAALSTKLEFTQSEWDAFGISDLHREHWTRASNSQYYKPLGLTDMVPRCTTASLT